MLGVHVLEVCAGFTHNKNRHTHREGEMMVIKKWFTDCALLERWSPRGSPSQGASGFGAPKKRSSWWGSSDFFSTNLRFSLLSLAAPFFWRARVVRASTSRCFKRNHDVSRPIIPCAFNVASTVPHINRTTSQDLLLEIVRTSEQVVTLFFVQCASPTRLPSMGGLQACCVRLRE